MVWELTFQRASVHPVHDARRLEDGKDLNDALLDFFVRLGQALVPAGGQSASESSPPVAYLGSHFYDVLRKGGVKDGREGHRNVANWAKRRLGKQGLFADNIGALAVPVNEVLWHNSYEGRTETQEKHWWLALILNPQVAGTPRSAGKEEEEDVSLLCLDSFVRAETKYEPPIRALKAGGSLQSYPVEVTALSRVGFNMKVFFRASGNGSAGGLPEPRRSRLRAGGREFANAEAELRASDRGGEGRPGRLEGALAFRLDRRGAAKTGGEYSLEYGDASDDYQPPLRLRMGQKPTAFQAQVAHFLGGYLAKEREAAALSAETGQKPGLTKLEGAVRLPGVPQQETSHDCGYFILEMILRALTLSAESLRELATASSVEIAMLPWPSQNQVFRRKAMLRDALDALMVAARQTGTGDVEALLKADPGLRVRTREALVDGVPSFQKGFDRWAAGDWDLSPSPSRSRSLLVNKEQKTARRSASRASRASSRSRSSRSRKRRKRRSRRADSSTSGSRRRRRRKRSRSSTRSPSSCRSASPKKSAGEAPPAAAAAAPRPQTFTMQSLECMKAAQLRELCKQHGVLPTGIVEREDLVKALAPHAAAPPPPPKAAAQDGRFTREDLDAMPSKALRALCAQHGRLPHGPVERGDLIQALAPLAVPA